MVSRMVCVTDLGGFDLFYLILLLFVGREAGMESES